MVDQNDFMKTEKYDQYEGVNAAVKLLPSIAIVNL